MKVIGEVDGVTLPATLLDVSCHLEAATPRPHQVHRFFGFWLEKSSNSKVSMFWSARTT
jgi:hypothetical protein